MVVRIVVSSKKKNLGFPTLTIESIPVRERNERCAECEYTWIKFVDQLSNEPVDMFRCLMVAKFWLQMGSIVQKNLCVREPNI